MRSNNANTAGQQHDQAIRKTVGTAADFVKGHAGTATDYVAGFLQGLFGGKTTVPNARRQGRESSAFIDCRCVPAAYSRHSMSGPSAHVDSYYGL